MQLSIRDIQYATEICHYLNTVIFFVDMKSFSSADVVNRSIIFSLNNIKTKEVFYSSLFHELAHIECYDRGLYERYHNDNGNGPDTLEYMQKIALRAERFVDSLGEKNMSTFLPKLQYRQAYKTKEEIDFLSDWVNHTYG